MAELERVLSYKEVQQLPIDDTDDARNSTRRTYLRSIKKFDIFTASQKSFLGRCLWRVLSVFSPDRAMGELIPTGEASLFWALRETRVKHIDPRTHDLTTAVRLLERHGYSVTLIDDSPSAVSRELNNAVDTEPVKKTVHSLAQDLAVARAKYNTARMSLKSVFNPVVIAASNERSRAAATIRTFGALTLDLTSIKNTDPNVSADRADALVAKIRAGGNRETPITNQAVVEQVVEQIQGLKSADGDDHDEFMRRAWEVIVSQPPEIQEAVNCLLTGDISTEPTAPESEVKETVIPDTVEAAPQVEAMVAAARGVDRGVITLRLAKEQAVKPARSQSRKALQQAFLKQLKADRGVSKLPKWYEVTPAEISATIQKLPSDVVISLAQYDQDSVLTRVNRSHVNSRLFSPQDRTTDQVERLDEVTKNRLKATREIIMSINRSKAAKQAWIRRKATLT